MYCLLRCYATERPVRWRSPRQTADKKPVAALAFTRPYPCLEYLGETEPPKEWQSKICFFPTSLFFLLQVVHLCILCMLTALKSCLHKCDLTKETFCFWVRVPECLLWTLFRRKSFLGLLFTVFWYEIFCYNILSSSLCHRECYFYYDELHQIWFIES